MQYQPYPKYKESNLQWIDEVPSKWKVIKLKFVCRFKTGWTPPTKMTEYFSGDNTWVTIADIKSKEVITSALSLTNEAVADFNMELVPKGSLLYSFKLSVGKVAFAGKDLYTNEAIFSVLPNADYIISFLYYLFPISVIQNASENIYGAKILNQELIKSSYLLMPELEDQKKIADFLDYKTNQIDQLIEKKKALIEKLNEQRIAVITQAVTKGLDKNAKMKPSGVDWLGDVPEHWDVRQLKFAATYNDESLSETTEPDKEIMYVDISSVNYIDGITDTEETTFEKAPSRARRIVRHGDTIISTVRTYLKAISAVNNPHENMIVSTGFSVIRPLDLLSSKFLSYFLTSQGFIDAVVSNSKGVSYPAINASELVTIHIAFPLERDEQNIIADYITQQLARINRMVNANNHAIDKLIEYREAIITAAVTGKIDVRDFDVEKDVA